MNNTNRNFKSQEMLPLTKDHFADLAEEVIKGLRYRDNRGRIRIDLTTNKIRNLLSLTNTLYNKAVQMRGDKIDSDLIYDLQYLKIRFAYESGRDPVVKDFVNQANIINYLNAIGDNREELLLFCRYMEALVAYHRFYGGKDR